MDQLTITEHNQNLQLWISRIRECRSSGLTTVEWCRQQGFNPKTYYYWMRKIKREAFEALPAEIKTQAVETTPVCHNTFAEIPATAGTEYKNIACSIRFRDIVLEVRNGADSVTVENVLRTLKSLC